MDKDMPDEVLEREREQDQEDKGVGMNKYRCPECNKLLVMEIDKACHVLYGVCKDCMVERNEHKGVYDGNGEDM